MRARWNRFKESYMLHSFLRDPVALGSFIILALLVFSAFAAPVIAPHNPYDSRTINVMDAQIPPAWTEGGNAKFLMGTDAQGRDILSTMLYGMRVSLLIGVGAVCLQAFIGIIVGLLSGYIRRLDTILMRIADVQLSFSTYMVAIFIGAIVQTIFGVAGYNKVAVPLLIVIIGLAEWPQYARTVRASVLAERKKEYVEAARVIGLPRIRIMWRHILPNTLSPVLVISTVQVANAIMSEAALSFLGLGMPVTKPSLGSLITAGFQYIFSGSWWITIFPGILLVTLILVINLLGDWLRDFLNPKLYKG
ncbi:MAG: ABC transporter permease [Pseudodesulfovibrio sp.]|uniref:Binding-protein-dependent transport systems inner membrane component n=1 Tax=Pseudodesulfovibrio aespoeensis (strain ATCC 700646 / DSM 10631 / Aspo-2) TaxID=643562 RepID=E6VRM3_PSEA9|nr:MULTISPECIES: ABC transporter permease [Pseudodesulfovibrio]MBU4380567.1 ABC transporter permease [Pseudomonadota bacterium]ADU63060.1 binding-protein-dependent transport systems inner membrane component [Pseudodesulfovibrio aespoeensis Aspo-2]MBU4476826.1 ABC transporter permease [Pseudomonadota bacterium]MBU4516672.1 ABC transporter permease [Pseudomonadota bacterium]MBU4522629.1 ABC transporter permease [Pseudomonadota bacterium]